MDGLSDDVNFGFIPAYTRLEPMNLQTNEGANRQGDMIHLPSCRPDLRLLNTATLFESSVVGLNAPCALGQPVELTHRHLEVVGCPVLRVSVWRDCPKHLDESVSP